MALLKADLHIHTNEDPQDYDIQYDSFKLIDAASEQGFDVLSITNHDSLLYGKKLREYASSKGIILIPGMEKTIEGKHVVFLNADFSEAGRIRRLADIGRVRGHESLVMAPHPFFPTSSSLGSECEKHIGSFDAVEYAGLYFKRFNFNRKAEGLARKYSLPLVGTSDAHFLSQMGSTFTLVEAERNVGSIMRALKAGRFRVETRPLPFTVESAKITAIFIAGSLKSGLFKGYNKGREKSSSS